MQINQLQVKIKQSSRLSQNTNRRKKLKSLISIIFMREISTDGKIEWSSTYLRTLKYLSSQIHLSDFYMRYRITPDIHICEEHCQDRHVEKSGLPPTPILKLQYIAYLLTSERESFRRKRKQYVIKESRMLRNTRYPEHATSLTSSFTYATCL